MQNGGGEREGRIAGLCCSVGFKWLVWSQMTRGHGLLAAFVPSLITWLLSALFYAKSVLATGGKLRAQQQT